MEIWWWRGWGWWDDEDKRMVTMMNMLTIMMVRTMINMLLIMIPHCWSLLSCSHFRGHFYTFWGRSERDECEFYSKTQTETPLSGRHRWAPVQWGCSHTNRADWGGRIAERREIALRRGFSTRMEHETEVSVLQGSSGITNITTTNLSSKRQMRYNHY